MIDRPLPTEHAPYYGRYIDYVPEKDILAVLTAQKDEIRRLVAAVPAAKETFAYAPGKWTIRELIGHLNDAERVFGFRAYTFSRRDPNPLPGFEEDDYIARSPYRATPLADLLAEFLVLRDANLATYRRLTDEQWTLIGNASGKDVSVRALAWMSAGHIRHHVGVLRERYGIAAG